MYQLFELLKMYSNYINYIKINLPPQYIKIKASNHIDYLFLNSSVIFCGFLLQTNLKQLKCKLDKFGLNWRQYN